MKSLLFLALSFSTAFSYAETPTKYQDMLLECRSQEFGIEGVLHGIPHSVWTQRHIQIYATKGSSKAYLVKDGVYDANNQGIFQLDEEYYAYKTETSEGTTFRAVTNAKKGLVIKKNKALDAQASGWPEKLKCAVQPY